MDFKYLIIFIDAYPFSKSNNLKNLLGSQFRYRLKPGIGYSINVKSELYAGLKPDDIRLFCEWSYDKDKRVSSAKRFCFKVLSKVCSVSQILDRVVHRFMRTLIGKPVYAIPFHILPYLKYSGSAAYEYDYAYPSIFTDYDFTRVLYSENEHSDLKVLNSAFNVIRSGKSDRIFVSGAELDSIMHRYGVESTQVDKHLSDINTSINSVVGEFLGRYGESARVIVHSDHGMAPVNETVSFIPEDIIGPPYKRYCYFIDATFFRFWSENDELLDVISNALDNLGEGRILSAEERQSFGVSNSAHGDIIYLLDEGKMFVPSFFGRTKCKAMHGYDPELESQDGVVLSSFKLSDAAQIRSLDFYKILSKNMDAQYE